jgi:hypothetical protein
VYRDLDDAVATSVRVLRSHSPDPDRTARLDAGYARYRRAVDALAGVDLDGDT